MTSLPSSNSLSDDFSRQCTIEEEMFSCKPAIGRTSGKIGEVQAAVDKIFGTGASSRHLLESSFPFAIADASLKGAPLIGCSAGFTNLSGYDMADIVGNSCRFLVDSVLSWEQIHVANGRNCRNLCAAAKEGKEYKMPRQDLDDWLSEDRPANELITVQTNSHKEGTPFNSMWLMRSIGLGDFDDEGSYIIAVQAEIRGGRRDPDVLRKHLQELDKNISLVEKMLAQDFIVYGTMHRQGMYSNDN